ncbi:MAG: hypothetical protein WA705_25415 [Candidatus Ozemobacteraceae bacterium]
MKITQILSSMFLLVIFVAVTLVGIAATPEDLGISYFKELSGGDRFIKGPCGVITDRQTKLQWMPGPNKEVDWNTAQAWINKLGKGWRTPSFQEVNRLLYQSEYKGETDFGRGRPEMPKIFGFTRPVMFIWLNKRDASTAFDIQITTGSRSFHPVVRFTDYRMLAIRND